jgi:hypothetical protein
VKIFDYVVLCVSLFSLGYFAGAIFVMWHTRRKFWLTPKE